MTSSAASSSFSGQTVMDVNEGNSEESDDYFTGDELFSFLGNGQQPVQERREWDRFKSTPPNNTSRSMAEQTCMLVSLQIVKVLAYICTFIFVLGGGVLSKGTLLSMTSQLRTNTTIEFCNGSYERQNVYKVYLPKIETVGWIWCLFFAYVIPEIFAFLRASRMCFFKSVTKPTILQFCVVATAETLRTIGTGLLVFMILPNLDVVKGAMLTNCLCFVPGLIALFNGLQEEVTGTPGTAYYLRHTINGLAVAAQMTGSFVWPILYEDLSLSVLHPIALFFISCGWWENFLAVTKIPAVLKYLKGLQDCRDYTLLYVSVWKIVCFFCIMLLVTEFQFDSLTVGDLFKLFSETFTQRYIIVTEFPAYKHFSERLAPVEATSCSTLWVLLIHALGSYICYISGKFACRILIQEIGFALPVTITVPVVVFLLITFSDPWYFEDVIPKYLFFHSPDCSKLQEYLNHMNVWLWLLWLLSQFWITLHIWKPNVDRLMPTEVLFTMPMYDSMFVDQSLALNRRHDKERVVLTEDHGDNDREEDEARMSRCSANMKPEDDPVKDADHIRQVFACITMWHETPDEMKQILKSVFRMDSDQSARRLAQEHFGVEDPDYYEFEAHVFFDDAFELSDDNDDEVVVNKYVKDLMDTVDIAASEVHSTECHVGPPVKFPTPYGGRLVWTLPGKTKMIVHLKNKDKIRHKKRWSQVMYLYYLLGHRLMGRSISRERKAVIKRNTFILALDGDIDFKPEAVLMLLDLMKKDAKLGAACGRIHPTGKGPMIWYQKFEYAISHWMQKATEHVIGCVLCSPGCFSLFRGKALMDDSVMHKYTTVSTEAKHYVQYDQGEDRWLSTLLLQCGYRVEYSAASDAYTHCPESFDELYNQRRRWIPSTMANIIDLLANYKQTVKINKNISFLYIIYQAFLFAGSILGPGSIFLVMVGALAAAFEIDTWTILLYNIVPIFIFMFVCYFCKERIQLTAAKIISTIYALVMMAVLVGIILQFMVNDLLAPTTLILFILVGVVIIAAILHPQEFWCVLAGLAFYVTIPAMYLLLIMYAIFNLNVVSWGTREETTKKSKMEIQKENKSAQKAKEEARLKLFWRFLRRDRNPKDNEEGSSEPSMVSIFICMCCTQTNGGEETLPLLRFGDPLENRSKGLDNNERAVEPAPQTREPRSTTFRHIKRDLEPMIENEENKLDDVTYSSMDSEDNESKEDWNDQMIPYWIDQPEMYNGYVDFLPSNELQFWNEFIDKYLFVPKLDEKKVQEDKKKLKDLRDLAVLAFCMLNALFVLVILLLQFHNDLLHIKWPSVGNDTEYLQLQPIGLFIIVGFGSIILMQFVAMLIHRFDTLSHILATTQIPWCQRITQNKDMGAKIAVQLAKDLQAPRGAEKDLKDTEVGRPKPVLHSLEVIFKGRLYKARQDGVVPERYRKLSDARRKSVSSLMDKGRKSVIQERRRIQSIWKRKRFHLNNKHPDAVQPITEEEGTHRPA